MYIISIIARLFCKSDKNYSDELYDTQEISVK